MPTQFLNTIISHTLAGGRTLTEVHGHSNIRIISAYSHITVGDVNGPNDLIVVEEYLVLNGVLSVAELTGFGPGVYRLLDYDGIYLTWA